MSEENMVAKAKKTPVQLDTEGNTMQFKEAQYFSRHA